MSFLFRVLGLCLIFTSIPTLAGDWSGSGDLGYNSVSGNSESDSLAAALSANYDTLGDWLFMGEFDTYSASQDGDTTAKTYSFKLQSDYGISERSFAFGNVRYLDDRFSGYDYQASTTIGLGKTFFDDGISLFRAQAGIGYRKNELLNGMGEESESIWATRASYNRALTESTRFESRVLTESGGDNTYVEGHVALGVLMTDNLGIKLSYLIKHNSDVPVDTENTDK
jgi:putative salt-induced outer membrane protein